MPSRDTLHTSVDKLPEAALEATERVLKNYQTWPSRPPITVQQMRERVEERPRNRRENCVRAYLGGGSSKPNGDSMSSMSTMDGPDLVNFEVRIFRGHRLELEERLHLSDDRRLLQYSQQIGGPDGRTNHYELEFNVSSLPPTILF
jgi:hypothetical protein